MYAGKHCHASLRTNNYFGKQTSLLSEGVVKEISASCQYFGGSFPGMSMKKMITILRYPGKYCSL